MRHRVGMRKLGRPTGHRLALIRNLMTDLIRHERLQTTEPKASELRREVERLISTARANDLHARRQCAAKLYDQEVVMKKLFAEIVPALRGAARRLHPHGQAHAAPRRRRADGSDRAHPVTHAAPSHDAELPRYPLCGLGHPTPRCHGAGHRRVCPGQHGRSSRARDGARVAPMPGCTPTARSSPSRHPRRSRPRAFSVFCPTISLMTCGSTTLPRRLPTSMRDVLHGAAGTATRSGATAYPRRVGGAARSLPTGRSRCPRCAPPPRTCWARATSPHSQALAPNEPRPLGQSSPPTASTSARRFSSLRSARTGSSSTWCAPLLVRSSWSAPVVGRQATSPRHWRPEIGALPGQTPPPSGSPCFTSNTDL